MCNRNERIRLGLGSPLLNPPSFILDSTIAALMLALSSSPVINQDMFVDAMIAIRCNSEMHMKWLVANKGVCEKCMQIGASCTNSGPANICCTRYKDHRIKCSHFYDYEVDIVADRFTILVEKSGKL
ncbi:hypothetical protein Hypma_003756 [Hypsizygus marmoreus]|uniref:Uncharacterized protein n=1 Tax=Hypsizygus marmoreus TaxID=39966 RepID=A0A369J8R7_HYPMA|nr:hypothetical protein Hypma_003756 [Hypsizygus marmoreus]